MLIQRLIATGLLLGLTTLSAFAVETSLTIYLGGDGLKDFERRVMSYDCEMGEPFSVTYINAAPNFLALVPLENDRLIFSSVLSASGAKYVTGHWVWWTKGAEARLYDLAGGEDAAPVNTCTEINNTP